MPIVSRRDFLATAGSFALTAAIGGPARAAMGPNDKFDLVIKGGDVLDPSQSLRGKRDIGIRYGLIEAVEADIPAARALRVLDAGGKLVTPGLIDLHCHVFPYGSAIGIPADELVRAPVHHHLRVGRRRRRQQFRRLPPLRRRRRRAPASMPSCTSPISGSPASRWPSSTTSTSRSVDAAARAVAENADIVLGIKVRMSENVIAKHGARAAQAGDHGLREVGHAAPR